MDYLTLERPHRKVEIAFLMTCKMIFESSKRCYFWTLTPAWAQSDRCFARSVHRFTLKMQHRCGGAWPEGFRAVRVFEPFKSGFLHCHFIANRRWPVQEIRRIAEGTGIGRIDVRVCNSGVADYLCKYLRKAAKLPNVRTWAKWGRWEHVRVGNVEVDSNETRVLKWCYKMEEYEAEKEFDPDTGRIHTVHRKKSASRRWVDARTRFATEMRNILRDRGPRLLTVDDTSHFVVDTGQHMCRVTDALIGYHK